MAIKRYLYVIGIVMIVLAILGWIHVLGVGAANSIFGSGYYLTSMDNWVYLVFGVLALAAGIFIENRAWLQWLTGIFGVLAIIYGIVGLFSVHFLGAYLDVTTNIINIIIGLTALGAVYSVMPEQIEADDKKECVGPNCPPKAV